MSLALATVQRMTGAGAIIQFTSKLFQISGSTVQANTASIITGIFQLAGSGVSIALIDKVGRRKLLLISSLVVAVCLTMLTVYFYYLTTGNHILHTRVYEYNFIIVLKNLCLRNTLKLSYVHIGLTVKLYSLLYNIYIYNYSIVLPYLYFILYYIVYYLYLCI